MTRKTYDQRPWRRGPRGYARIIELLHRGPLSVPELAAKLNTTAHTVRIVMRGLESQGLAQRIGSVKQPGVQGVPSAVWGLGGTPNTTRCRVETIAFGHFLRALRAGPVTRRELSEASGFCAQTINRLLRQMRRDGLAHIFDWDRHSHIPVPCFCYGPGINAPRPKPTPQHIISARWARAQQAKREQALLTSALTAAAGEAEAAAAPPGRVEAASYCSQAIC